ncbi:MAG: hypothetical protein M1598_03285 [Actinobacteria bacterium]|nr:hypothetical protein [Actinomycetota bacterium]
MLRTILMQVGFITLAFVALGVALSILGGTKRSRAIEDLAVRGLSVAALAGLSIVLWLIGVFPLM